MRDYRHVSAVMGKNQHLWKLVRFKYYVSHRLLLLSNVLFCERNQIFNFNRIMVLKEGSRRRVELMKLKKAMCKMETKCSHLNESCTGFLPHGEYMEEE